MNGIRKFIKLRRKPLVEQLVAYIEKELKRFPNSKEFLDILEKKKNENQHSLSFCVYMTNKCKSKFHFARENAQSGSSTVDIGVYRGSVLFFTIEAKLLPTPTPKGTKRKEYEYVYGDGAGIQRFKEGKHGVDNRGKNIPINGLIAFVKENDFTHWHKRINQWILDAGWQKSEQLPKIHINTTAKLKSTHPRVGGSQVVLHHFWVYV